METNDIAVFITVPIPPVTKAITNDSEVAANAVATAHDERKLIISEVTYADPYGSAVIISVAILLFVKFRILLISRPIFIIRKIKLATPIINDPIQPI